MLPFPTFFWFLLFFIDRFKFLYLSPSPIFLSTLKSWFGFRDISKQFKSSLPLRCPSVHIALLNGGGAPSSRSGHTPPQNVAFSVFSGILFYYLLLSVLIFNFPFLHPAFCEQRKGQLSWSSLPTLASTISFLLQQLKREPPGMSSSPTSYLNSTISGNLDSGPFTTLKQLLPNDFQVA